MPPLDFFYFFGSAYAYLSVQRIGRLAAEAGVPVNWRPINVRPLMAHNNVALRTRRSRSPTCGATLRAGPRITGCPS